MADSPSQLPEQYRPAEQDFNSTFNELAADQAGGMAPFGVELDLPLPIEKLRYEHPGPADRPHLADGR